MLIDKFTPWSEILETGKVLNIKLTNGSVIVEGFKDLQKVISLSPFASTKIGPYPSDILFKVSLINGVADVFESYSFDQVPGIGTDASGNVIGFISPRTGKTVTGLSSLRDKIRKAYADQVSKPYAITFWNTPSAWVTATAVSQGEARSSNGNWYVALASGTTGANAPNLTNPLLTQPFSSWNDGAADGSGIAGVSWSYLSAIQPVYNRDLSTVCAVSFSATTDATLTNIYTPVTGAYGTPTSYVRDLNTNSTKQFIPSGTGCTAVFAPFVGDLFKAPNASSITIVQTSGGALGVQSSFGNKNASGNIIGSGYWEFNTDSSKIQFATSQFDSGQLNGGGTRVLVDDVEVSPSAFFASTAITGALGNSNLYTVITMTAVKRIRNVKVIGLNSIRDIRTEANSALHFVQEQSLSILWIGDSISAGSAMGPSRSSMQWPQVFANEIGIKGICNASVGGTGFESSGSGYNFLQRVTESTSAFAPSNLTQYSASTKAYDVVIIQASGNDGSVSTTLQSQQLATLQMLRTLQPDALIIVHGAWPGGQSYSVSADYCDAKAQAAFAQWADGKSIYLQTRAGAAGGAWITGTGYNKLTFTSATGNSSFYVGNDATHPNDAGITYYAKRTLSAIYQALEI